MTIRTEIPAADLYVMLQREFRRRQVPQCTGCYVQFPFRVDRSDGDASNWEVILPAGCNYGCRELMDEVVEEFARRYDLAVEPRN